MIGVRLDGTTRAIQQKGARAKAQAVSKTRSKCFTPKKARSRKEKERRRTGDEQETSHGGGGDEQETSRRRANGRRRAETNRRRATVVAVQGAQATPSLLRVQNTRKHHPHPNAYKTPSLRPHTQITLFHPHGPVRSHGCGEKRWICGPVWWGTSQLVWWGTSQLLTVTSQLLRW